jgi:sec-independent protein translocase protein TatA
MNTMFALFDLGGMQIVVILVLILVFFGARRIPELARGLGQGIREFKKATREVTDEIQNAGEDRGPGSVNSQSTQSRQIADPQADKSASEKKT